MKPFTVLLLGLAVLAPRPAQPQIMGDVPTIRSLAPGVAAAGFGQLITIQGHSLIGPAGPEFTAVTFTQGLSFTADGFVFVSPSNPSEVYVRLPFGLAAGKAEVTVRRLDKGTASKPFALQVKQKPGAPIPRRLCDPALPGCPTISGAAVGKQIGIAGYGTDTTGANAVFSQGDREFVAPLVSTISNDPIGVVSLFVVPDGLAPGRALVQTEVTVNGNPSPLSFALPFTVQ